MVSHASLVSEIEVVNSMSTEDRLTHARQRRQEQIQRWHDAQSEKECEDGKAMINGDAKSGKRNVKFGASVTLLEAAARDDVNEVKSLLENKTDPNEANDDGLTALHQACIDNFEDMVKLLNKFGANVNAVDSEQWTPLHAACTCGHTNIARILIQNGADLLALNADHNMPYDICEDDETLDFVEKAMAAKGITQEQINDTRSSKERQIIEDMQSLIDQGKSPGFKDEAGATVLHIAAANGYAELSKFLISNGCKVNIQDNDGWTPLHAAACWNQLDIVELLGQHGGDPTIKNSLGEIPAEVTDDEEIKIVLVKIKSTMKDKKRRLFPGFRISSRNNSRRASGIRGQSFKGRSKRDKKSGIATMEAKSEAQFWSGHQETSDITPDSPTENNNHIENLTTTSINPATQNGHKKAKNGHKNASKKDSASSLEDISNHAATKNKSSSNPSKKDKKQKKVKKPKENEETVDGSELTAESQQTELNGGRCGGVYSVIGTRNSYSLEGDGDLTTAYSKDRSNSSSGMTLAELKRERAQEKSNKVVAFTNPEGSYSPIITFSEELKQYRGQTANELSGRSNNKRKFCVIL